MSEELDREMDEKSVSEKIEEKVEELRRKAKALGFELVKKGRPVKYTEEQIGALLDGFRRIFSERKGGPTTGLEAEQCVDILPDVPIGTVTIASSS